MPQFLVDSADVDELGGAARLRGEEARHLARVMRARAGEEVLLFDGGGRRWRGLFSREEGADVLISGLSPLPSNEDAKPVHLAVGLIKGERWDWLIEKAVELGVGRITPLLTERTVVRPKEEKNQAQLARWTKIAASAAKQCERGLVPHIDTPVALGKFLESLPRGEPERRLAFVERTEGGLETSAAFAAMTRIAVGPEGGWTQNEVKMLQDAGYAPASLGARVLRGETAVLAALALVSLKEGHGL